LLQEQIELSQELLQENLTTKYKHLELERQATRIKGEIDEALSALKEAGSSLFEAKEKLEEFKLSFKKGAIQDLKETNQKLKEYSERLIKYQDRLHRTVVCSPVDGVVKKMYPATKGGVIKPGDAISDIVPSGDSLIVEAHLPVSDIGYVHSGQKGFVKLPSRDARKFDKLKAKVVSISPDTFTNEHGRTFYNVHLQTEKNYFSCQNQKYRLYPGMLLLAYIHIGKRTVLEYLLDPFLNTFSFSLQER
jgi:adhesin transport system membrane fusion protein